MKGNILKRRMSNYLDRIIDFTIDLRVLEENQTITTEGWNEVVQCVWRIAELTGTTEYLKTIREEKETTL